MAFRANGILNIGYIGFYLMLKVVLNSNSCAKKTFNKIDWNLFKKVFFLIFFKIF